MISTHLINFFREYAQANDSYGYIQDQQKLLEQNILNSFEQGQNGMNSTLNVTKKDRQVISAYLTTCLGIHFEDVKQLKSLEILREMVAS